MPEWEGAEEKEASACNCEEFLRAQEQSGVKKS